MNTRLVLEQLAKRDRTHGMKTWRIVEREVRVRPDGRSRMTKTFALIKRDLTLDAAFQGLQCARDRRSDKLPIASLRPNP